MKTLIERKYRLIVILTVFCQLLNSFCSRKMNPAISDNSHISSRNDAFAPVRPHPGNQEKKIEAPDIKNKPEDILKSDAETAARMRERFAGDVIATAMKYFGVPHCMGGTTTKCIDCSGLVMKVYAVHGITLPHSAQAQSEIGTVIENRSELVKGDLVFFKNSYKTSKYITHSGIYAGDNMFIHASSGKGVTITSLDDPWWKNKFVFGTRILD